MKLQDYLKETKTSVREFADSLGVRRETVHNYIRNFKRPDDMQKARIEQITGGAVPFEAWKPELEEHKATPVAPSGSGRKGAQKKRVVKS